MSNIEQDVDNKIVDKKIYEVRRERYWFSPMMIYVLRMFLEKYDALDLSSVHRHIEELWVDYHQTGNLWYLGILTTLDADGVFEPLVEAIENDNSPMKSVLLSVIGFTGNLQALPLLIEEVENGDVRSAARSLGRLRHSAAVPALAAHLTPHSNSLIIDSVISALKAIGSPEAMAALANWEMENGSESLP